MKTRNFLKKMIALVLVLAMLIPTTISNLGTNVKEVQAADTASQVTDESVGYVVVSKANVNTDGSQPTVKADYENGQYSDYLFAGWYSDEKALTASSTGEYARFVPADVLSIKVQVTNGLVTDTLIDDYENKYVMRFLTSVDSLDYKNAGFVITYEEDGKTITRTNTTTTGFKRIDSATGSTQGGMDTYEFSPKVISTKSEYFVTAKWPVVDTAQKITVKAFWTTNDGQRVYGGSRCVSVAEGLENATTTNISFKSLTAYNVGATIDNVTYGTHGTDGAYVQSGTATATVIGRTDNSDGTYAIHTSVDVNPDVLTSSVTTFTFGSEETAIYRNLYTQYTETTTDSVTTNTADRTWYNVNKSAEEFVIASSADFYGLAAVVNGGESFADKTVYVVADIKANKGKATETGWSIEGVTGGTEYKWTPIGNATVNFQGIFDGQMHTISGINMNSSSSMRNGLFGYVLTGAIQNLKLTNSYFYSAAARLGSIVGEMGAVKLDSIYSDAIVTSGYSSSEKAFVGGLVGVVGNSTSADVDITNCWFDGTVTNNSATKDIGGLVGYAYTKTLDIENCLNTGSISATAVTHATPRVGGFVGYNQQGILTITNSIYNALSIDCPKTVYSFVGMNTATLNLTNVYYGGLSAMYYNYNATANENSCTAITTDTDYSALLNSGNYWTETQDETPILISFEDVIINPDTSWINEAEGTAQDPYVIYDRNDFYGLALLSQTDSFAGKTIRLGADIVVNKGNATDWDELEPQYEWTPIGNATYSFAGTFDGSDPETGKIHSISGIYLKNDDSMRNGLFASVSTGTIKNLKLKNSYFYSAAQRLGSIAGEMGAAKLDTIYSDAIVTSGRDADQAFVGGLVGIVGNSTTADVDITNCWFDGTVTNNNVTRDIGGLVGWAYTKTLDIKNCMNTGVIHAPNTTYATPRVGGFVGYNQKGTLTITNSIHNASINCSKRANCTVGLNTAVLNLTSVYYGGYSYVYSNSGGDVTNATGYAKIETDTDYTALINSGAWVAVEGIHPILKSFASGVVVPDISWYDETQNTYVLYNVADLYGFAELSQDSTYEGFAGKTIKLGADIVINKGDSKEWAQSAPKYTWTPIGQTTAFAGTFDGSDPETGKIHSISGIYLNNSDSVKNGLFGSVSTGTITNLKLTNSYFYSAAARLGSIVGEMGAATLDTIYSDAIVTSNFSSSEKAFVGGLVGIVGNSTSADVDITNCWFNGTVTNNKATKDIGGLVGWAYTQTLDIENCLNTGIINAPNTTASIPRVGGFVGYNQKGTLTITNSIHNAPINCQKEVNSFVGLNTAVLKLTDVYYGGHSRVYSNYNGDVTNATGYTKIAADTDYSVLTNTDAWVSIDTYTIPALASFPYSNVTPSTTTYNVDANSVKLVGATNDQSYAYAQGGCYAEESDGGYFYQAYLTYRNISDENKNTVVIVKYDLNGDIISQSSSLSLNHANDMTYNSNTGKLIVCHESGAANKISIIDPVDWTVTEKELIFNMYCIDYDATQNKYVVGVSTTHDIYVLDENFNVIECYTNIKTDPKATATEGPQGMCCDEQYIYYLYSGSATHAITVFDWEGNYIKEINFTQSGEPENISAVDGKIYVSYVRRQSFTAIGATLYTLTPQQ